jgi:chloride channel protein, CIC family
LIPLTPRQAATLQRLQAIALTLWHRLHRLLAPKRVAVLEASLIGLVSALAAGSMAQGVEWLGYWRLQWSQRWPDWIVLPIVGAVGALLSGWLIQREAPEASGSGMSQVKAVLARVPMPLNLRVALVKLVSAVLALGSGLALGREGPTVQVGAALAAQLSHWLPTSPDQRRQLIAAGAGAGVAAAVNAPISGVLFVAEQLLQDVSGGTLGTAILASFIGSSVSRLIGGSSLDVDLDTAGVLTNFRLVDLPSCLVLGILCGVLGTLFNRGILASLKFNRRLGLSLPWRMAIAGLLTGLFMCLLPALFRDNTVLKDGLLSGGLGWQVTAIAFVVQFVLILLAYGSGAPGGLLVPTLILGAALGSCLGSLQLDLLKIGVPVTLARVGMGAFMAATAKAPITAVVMVFEMTRDFNLVLPLMIAVVMAYLTAERLFPGSFYDKLLELNGIKLEEAPTASAKLTALNAAQVMQRQVETLPSNMTVDEAVQAFSRSHHRGFPVVEGGRLVGIITQTDLNAIAQHNLPGDALIHQIMTPAPVTVGPESALSDVLYLLNRNNLSRLPVVSGRKLVGIITRSDIIRAEASELSGTPDQSGQRYQPSYVVYQTRSPAVGQGRLLVPLANPQTATALLQIAAAIAREQDLELECLQVMLVPRHSDPASTPVRTSRSCKLLKQAERIGRSQQIGIHTQVRVAQDVAQAIFETLQESPVQLVLMGWEGYSSTPERIFGSVVDTIIRQAPCQVILVKLANSELGCNFDRWLVPIAGGPNVQAAIQLLPTLATLSKTPQIRLCQVFDPQQSVPNSQMLQQDLALLQRKFSTSVSSVCLRSKAVAEAIIDLAAAEQDDVILLGASRESLLQQAIKGNIPEAIARNSPCTVILVRDKIS